MTGKLTHLDDAGHAHMVDVSAKDDSDRMAVAEGIVRMGRETVALLLSGGLPKGDAIAVARVAGIMAAKRTAELVPLCHPIAISGVTVDIEPDEAAGIVLVRASVKTRGPTGVEMEALTAVSVAALTLYDMVKAVARGTVIEAIRLVSKSGGRSGTYVADAEGAPATPGKMGQTPRRSTGFRNAPSSTITRTGTITRAGAGSRVRGVAAPEQAPRPRADDSDKERAALRNFMAVNRLRVTQWCKDAGIPAALLYGYLHGRSGRLSRDLEEKLASAARTTIDAMFAAP